MILDKKCKLDNNGKLVCCSIMEKILEKEINASVQGFVRIRTFDFKINKSKCLGIMYRDSYNNRSCNKIMLNFCPFCGERISKQEEE